MNRKARLVLILLAAAALIASTALLPVGSWLLALVAWVRGAGVLGVIVFAIAYVLATVLLLPGSVLTLGAGFAWGPLGALAIVSPASVLGATLAFLLGRTLMRDRVAGWIGSDRRFAAVDDAIGRQGFGLVALLRLSPVFPFVLLNYALGLTKVGTRDYVLASLLGMLPGTFLFCYLGSTVSSLAAILSGEATQDPLARWAYWGGLVATGVVTVLVTRIATRALRQRVDLPDEPEETP